MREPEKGKVYCLIRQVEQGNRMISVCRRVKVLETEEEQVVLDQGDGIRNRMEKALFWEIAREE